MFLARNFLFFPPLLSTTSFGHGQEFKPHRAPGGRVAAKRAAIDAERMGMPYKVVLLAFTLQELFLEDHFHNKHTLAIQQELACFATHRFSSFIASFWRL